MSFGKGLLIAAAVFGVWQGIRSHHSGPASIGASISGDVSEQELRQLSSAVKSDDVLIYTTTECPYCAQAKAWMTQYGFHYRECDAQVSNACAAELERLGGVGVPYLIVRGHHMKDGFDSDEFVAALRE